MYAYGFKLLEALLEVAYGTWFRVYGTCSARMAPQYSAI